MTETATIKLIPEAPGLWKSEDGRVEIHHDHTFETTCDEPHPVRYRLDYLETFFSPDYVHETKRRGNITSKRLKSGEIVQYVSYQCFGNEDHWYAMWTVMIDDDWTDDVYETFEHARGVVEEALGIKTIRGRKPKPKPETLEERVARSNERERAFDETTGAATWKRCGHRAELDINENCYTCGEPV